MNYGPLIFLAAFFALSASWLGFVFTPQVQVGYQQQTNMVGSSALYPQERPGLARQGLDVYRENGCMYCHSKQVGQTGTVADVFLADAGTNQAALVEALRTLNVNGAATDPEHILSRLPGPILRGLDRTAAEAAMKVLEPTGATAALSVVPVGPDIERGWGRRRTVARDYLFDYPVMLGTMRSGPDLANVGSRLPDPNWHLRHFYAPRAEVEGSTMPPYRYLFDVRKIDGLPSTDALQLPPEFAPPAGFEVVPKPEAYALVAYMLSLRADAPLFEAPLTSAAAVAATNAPGSNATNDAPATVSPQ